MGMDNDAQSRNSRSRSTPLTKAGIDPANVRADKKSGGHHRTSRTGTSDVIVVHTLDRFGRTVRLSGRLSHRAARRSLQEVEVLRASLHGMNEQLIPTVEAQDNQFQEPTVRVETQPELARGVVVVQTSDIYVMLCRVDAIVFADPVFERGFMRLHATWVQARTASRIASERETCSCSARAFNAFNNASSIRTGTTAPGPSPTVGRPRLRNLSTS